MRADCISVGELQELLAAGEPVTVLDVRSPSDVDWKIPGAIHVDAYAHLQSSRLGPLAELDLRAGPVVTVCAVGRTAAIATELLRANGVEALTLDGGMRSWSLAWNTAQTTISGCEIVQVRREAAPAGRFIRGVFVGVPGHPHWFIDVDDRVDAVIQVLYVDRDIYGNLAGLPKGP